MARRGAESGQASVELIAAIPALTLVVLLVAQLTLAGLIALQLLAAGYSLTLADGAAEAGAMALAAGRPAVPAVREALPGWARDRVAIDVHGGRLTVRLRPPSPIGALARRLELRSS